MSMLQNILGSDTIRSAFTKVNNIINVVNNFGSDTEDPAISGTFIIDDTITLSKLSDALKESINQIDVLDLQVQSLTTVNLPKLVYYPYEITATAGQTDFEIPLSIFDKDTDTCIVYLNTRIARMSNYSITQIEGELGHIIFTSGLDENDLVLILIFKNVPVGEDGTINGAVMALETVPVNRVIGLTSVVNNVTSLTNDQGTYQSTWRLNDAILNDCTILGNGNSSKLATSTIASTLSSPLPFSNTLQANHPSGIVVTPSVNLSAITCIFDDSNIGATRIQLINHTTEEVLQTSTLSGTSTVTINYSFQAGTSYRILIDNSDSSWTCGYDNGATTFPLVSSGITINSGYTGTSVDSSHMYAIYKIKAFKKVTKGTITKTITPPIFKKWGSVEWGQVTPPTTSVVCDIRKVPAEGDVASSAPTNESTVNNLFYGTKRVSGKIIVYNSNMYTDNIKLKINSIDRVGYPGGLKISVYSGVTILIGSIEIDDEEITLDTTIEKEIVLSQVMSKSASNDYRIVLSTMNNGGDGSNYYNWRGHVVSDSGNVYLSDDGISWTSDTAQHLQSIVTDVSTNLVIRPNVTSVANISDITDFPLSIRWTLEGVNSLAQITLNKVSITWKGSPIITPETLQNEIDDMKNLCGTGTFNSTAGVTINHNAGTANYIVQITISSSDPTGAVGVFWTESKTDISFVVKNTGDAGFNFDWLLIKLPT